MFQDPRVIPSLVSMLISYKLLGEMSRGFLKIFLFPKIFHPKAFLRADFNTFNIFFLMFYYA